MIRIARILVTTAVVATLFCAAPSAEAGSFQNISIDGEASWFQTAWTWVSEALFGQQDSDSFTSSTDKAFVKPIGGGDGGTTTNTMTGSCIDPLGNPVPCNNG
jgi:hypothetical protein